MSRLRFGSSLLAALLAPLVAAAADPAADAAKPVNFLFILADDLGTPPISAYGGEYYRTPAIDSLARDGLKFTDAYAACPVCSPTRGALMTGQYPARTHLTDFIPGASFPRARLAQPDWQKFLPLSATTIAEVLGEHGYVTALFGKWHLARGYFPPESVAEGPDHQGFAETFITQKPKKGDDPEADAHNVEAVTVRALDFLSRHRDEPFLLEISHNSIHAPVMAPRALVEKYRQRPGADQPQNNPVIAAMMEVLDDSVARILAQVDALGLRERTVVVFYGDNGGLLADGAQTPWRGGKAQLYEGGIRVPLLVRWPGGIAPGRVSSMPVTTVDFFPTFLELAGVPTPRGVPLDGVSLAGYWRGGSAPVREAIFWHYPHYHAAGSGGPGGAVRAGDWKLIEYYEHTLAQAGRAPELYNLRSDPGETQNLAAREPARVDALLALLAAHRTSTGAQMPVVNPAYDPAGAKPSRP